MDVEMDRVPTPPVTPSAHGGPYYAERRKQLKPWLHALHDAALSAELMPLLPTVSDIQNLWLMVVAPEGRRDNPEVWTLLMEAMELLDLLARVDQKAAWHLLIELTPHKEIATQYEEVLWSSSVAPLVPKFLVSIEDESLLEGQDTAQGLIHMLIKNELQSSKKYEHVKQALLAEWAEAHEGEMFDRNKHGRVKLSLEFHVTVDMAFDNAVGVVFSQIQDLAFAHADPSAIVLDIRGSRGTEGAATNENGESGDGEANGEADEGEGRVGEENADDADENAADEDANENAAAAENEGEAEAEAEDGEGRAVAAREPRVRRQRGPFEFDSFRIDLGGLSPVSNLVLYLINETGKSGMRFSHFTFTSLLRDEVHHSTIGGFLLNQLVPWSGRRDGFGIEYLDLEAQKFDASAVRALCTAIAHSRSLKELKFDSLDTSQPNHAGREVWWPWLAYALFSGEADHKIHTASLNVEGLLSSHVRQVREVLDHTDPLAFLYQVATAMEANDDDDEEEKQPVVVKSVAMNATLDQSALLRLGHYRYIAPENLADVPSLRVREPGVSYQVVRNRDGEDYIEFLLPGTGVCWTERSALLELKPIAQRSQHSIRHLTLHALKDADIQPVVELLRLVGGPIEHLTLAESDGHMDGSSLSSLIACCPNLKRLDVNDLGVDGFEWLMKWPADHPCQLDTLCLEDIRVVNPLRWTGLFEYLADMTRPLTRSLRRLHFYFPRESLEDDDDDDDHAAVVDSCLAMLEDNVILQHFEIRGLSSKFKTKYKQRFAVHNNEPIAHEDAPLPRREKMAVLSVFTPSKAAQEPLHKQQKQSKNDSTHQAVSAQQKLDSDMLRKIMAFAAKPKRRICAMY